MSDQPKIGLKVASAVPPSNNREVLVIGREAPAHVGATRLAHIGRLAGMRKYVWPTALIGGGLFLLGSTTGNPLLALTPLLLVLLVQVARVWREASRFAERDFFAGYAIEKNFNYSERMMLMAATPLLAAGDRRRCTHYIEGQLQDIEGASVALAHLIVETKVNKYDRRKRPIPVLTPHNFTVAIVDLQRPSKAFPGVYIQRRPKRMTEDWLDRRGLVPVMLSNGALSADCELLVRAGQNPDRLRLLVNHTLEAWLAVSELKPGLEFQDGTLLVYTASRLRTQAELDELVSLTSRIAKHLISVGEPLRAVDAPASHGPPTGVEAFPAPPPATRPPVEPTLKSVASIAPTDVRSSGPGRRSVPPPGS
jgi:hypothetical protein